MTETRKTLDPSWPAEQRMEVVGLILQIIQSDVYVGRYSQPGRPNCQSALHILFDDAVDLGHLVSDADVAKLRAMVDADNGVDHGSVS